MMKKYLLVATVVKLHVKVFHLPLLKQLKEEGYEVHVAAHNDYEDSEEYDIPYCDKFYNLPFERSPIKYNNILAYKKLKKIIDYNEYDIIHSHTPVGGVVARLAARQVRKRGTKVIYTAHGFHFYKGGPLKNWLLYYPVERLLANLTDGLITINKEDYAYSKKFSAKHHFYIPGVGIDLAKFKIMDEESKREKRAELNLSDDDFLLISVGELSKRKNHEVVIRALGKIKNPHIKYLICGEGDKEADLKKLAKSLNIEKRVKFLGFRKDIQHLCNISNVFLFPSLQEGLPVAVMEAMACGLPVIASNIRGSNELIDDEQGGYLITGNDIDSYSDKIVDLYNHPDLSSQMGAYNLIKIKDFEEKKILELMQNVYSTLTNE